MVLFAYLGGHSESKPFAKAETFQKKCQIVVFANIEKHAKIWSGAPAPLQGELSEFCPRVEIEKTLTADRVPGQSARKVSWLFKGQVDVKEGAPEALPVMISVNANTQWVSFKRAACA